MYRDPFEKLAVNFATRILVCIPDHLASLVFASPISTRSTDVCMLWHTDYRRNHLGRLFIVSFISLAVAFIKGFFKLIGKFRQFGYVLYGEIKDTILIMASTCGSETNDGAYKTPYVLTQHGDVLFVFGLYKQFENYNESAIKIKELPIIRKILFLYILIKSGVYAFFYIQGPLVEKTLLLLKWFSWVVSLQWLFCYYLEITLLKIVACYNIKKIGCIHEMHDYSRIVWRVASKYNLKSYTVQHAAITEGKRWFFTYPEEQEAGLALPNIMFVYNQKVVELLKPYYKYTVFPLGSSSRYTHWKDIKVCSEHKGKYYLFVSALPRFDNNIIIDALRRIAFLIKGNVSLRLRLHPAANLGYKNRYWIHSLVKKKYITVSKNTSLRDDIEDAIAVIGMNTTVLEEALLLERPVIQLTHPDYLQYIDLDGIKGVIKVDCRKFSGKDLVNACSIRVDYERMRERFGLDQTLVTYKLLFQP